MGGLAYTSLPPMGEKIKRNEQELSMLKKTQDL